MGPWAKIPGASEDFHLSGELYCKMIRLRKMAYVKLKINSLNLYFDEAEIVCNSLTDNSTMARLRVIELDYRKAFEKIMHTMGVDQRKLRNTLIIRPYREFTSDKIKI